MSDKAKIPKEDIDFIRDANAMLAQGKNPYAKYFTYLTGAFFLIALLWAHFAVIDEITMGTGKIVPSSDVQQIQNLEGGTLNSLQVEEGDHVTKGQVLLQMDDTFASSSYEDRRNRYLSLLAEIARLSAEIKNEKTVTFSPELQDYPNIRDREEALFNKRQQSFDDSLGALKKNYDLASKELSIIKPLVAEGVSSEVELLRLEREVNELKGKLDEKQNLFREEAQNQLNKDQTELASLKENLRSDVSRVERTTIRSPVDGIVKRIAVTTLGQVIKPGEDIMEIVPLEDKLLVEVKVRPADIAFIHPGQKATIKVSAYDYAIYGGLDAVVTYISADTITEADQTFYKVNLRTDKNFLGTEKESLPIIPGMTVTAHIVTGHKTVLDYLLKPILHAKERALRER